MAVVLQTFLPCYKTTHWKPHLGHWAWFYHRVRNTKEGSIILPPQHGSTTTVSSLKRKIVWAALPVTWPLPLHKREPLHLTMLFCLFHCKNEIWFFMLLLLTCILLGKREKLLEVPYGGCKVKCRIVLLCLHPTQECYILCEEEDHLEPIFPCSLQCYFHVHLCRPIVCTFSPVVHTFWEQNTEKPRGLNN